jgi:hypothetical protein
VPHRHALASEGVCSSAHLRASRAAIAADARYTLADERRRRTHRLTMFAAQARCPVSRHARQSRRQA